MGFGNFILTQQSKATASRFLKGRRGKKITAHYTRKMYNTVSVCVCVSMPWSIFDKKLSTAGCVCCTGFSSFRISSFQIVWINMNYGKYIVRFIIRFSLSFSLAHALVRSAALFLFWLMPICHRFANK